MGSKIEGFYFDSQNEKLILVKYRNRGYANGSSNMLSKGSVTWLGIRNSGVLWSSAVAVLSENLLIRALI
jgi:hypothetical protein